MRSCAFVFAQSAMAGLADLDADARGERGGQAKLRAEHAENQRIAALDQFDTAAHAHAKHLETLRFLVVGLDAPHDGANARRQRVQANHLFRNMVNCCHDLCKISFPASMSNTPRGRVDAGSILVFYFLGAPASRRPDGSRKSEIASETPAFPGQFVANRLTPLFPRRRGADP